MNLFQGKNSTERFQSKEKCKRCRKNGVYYLGSSVEHGNPFCGTADTDVTHYYRCSHCQKEFETYA